MKAQAQESTQEATRHWSGGQLEFAAAYRPSGALAAFGESAQSVAQRRLGDVIHGSRQVMQLKAQIEAVDASPRMAAQRAQLTGMFGAQALQRASAPATA